MKLWQRKFEVLKNAPQVIFLDDFLISDSYYFENKLNN